MAECRFVIPETALSDTNDDDDVVRWNSAYVSEEHVATILSV
jgi:hypothetical protein